jgi:hypothetical protein
MLTVLQTDCYICKFKEVSISNPGRYTISPDSGYCTYCLIPVAKYLDNTRAVSRFLPLLSAFSLIFTQQSSYRRRSAVGFAGSITKEPINR